MTPIKTSFKECESAKQLTPEKSPSRPSEGQLQPQLNVSGRVHLNVSIVLLLC